MLGEHRETLHLHEILTRRRHYVAFIKKYIPDTDSHGWVLFNDEKVAKAADVDEMKKFAYIYFFRRQ